MACSSTRISLAKLRIVIPSFIFAMTSLLIMPFVDSMAGTWIVMKSLTAQTSSNVSACTTRELSVQADFMER